MSMGRNHRRDCREFVKQVRKYYINHHVVEPERKNQNPGEGVIRELRRKWFRTMVLKRVPRSFWNYGIQWVEEIMSLTLTHEGGLNRRCPWEGITGETAEISEYLDFDFYDHCWYHNNAGISSPLVGRWLRSSHWIGSAMSYWILTKTGNVISRTTVQQVTDIKRD